MHMVSIRGWHMAGLGFVGSTSTLESRMTLWVPLLMLMLMLAFGSGAAAHAGEPANAADADAAEPTACIHAHAGHAADADG
mmetsp:Transcript_40128/g.119567  ORF Transcript_40128/g.119567 Transcript_40128/m.119567 type:complete len:81 (+) Transcript_40128:325-567(+)